MKTIQWLKDFTIGHGIPLKVEAGSRSLVRVITEEPMVLSIPDIGQFEAKEGKDFEFVDPRTSHDLTSAEVR